MPSITYTAKRSIISGHSEGAEYSLEIDLQSFTPASNNVTKQQRALGGNTQTILHRIDKSANLSTDYFTQADLPAWQEFADSVAAGESFTLDPYGSIASPVAAVQYALTGAVSFARIGTTEYFTMSATVRAL